jgi:predicted TIM-barrel fold metal-dependent hydrolase
VAGEPGATAHEPGALAGKPGAIADMQAATADKQGATNDEQQNRFGGGLGAASRPQRSPLFVTVGRLCRPTVAKKKRRTNARQNMQLNRADAHLHFFAPGYVALLPESCRRAQPDEVTLYAALARQHNITQVLAIGYQGQPWAAGNNRYLAELAAAHPWIRPAAFIHDPAMLEVPMLESLALKRFVGLSLYLFDQPVLAALGQVADDIWSWLAARRWLISVNSRGDRWAAWAPILKRHPNLRLLVSHLGLPPLAEHTLDQPAAQHALEAVLALARFPEVRVKLSGFYALTAPGYDYPHRAAWPYVATLLAAFGADRLLWGSDFSPSLEWVSFPQTFGLLAQMPFLNDADLRRIEGESLLALLAEIV